MKSHRKLLLKYWSDLSVADKKNWLINLCYNTCPFVELEEPFTSVDEYIESLSEEQLDIIFDITGDLLWR